MLAIKLPHLAGALHFAFIAILLTLGLLFWAVSTR